MIYLAVIGAGGRFVGSNPSHKTFELNNLFNLSEVRFVVVEPDLLWNILLTIDKVGLPRSNVFIFNSKPLETETEFRSWKKLLEHGEEDWTTFNDENKARATTAALLTTSGTTGLPKAAELSHYSFVAQGTMLSDLKEKPYEVS